MSKVTFCCFAVVFFVAAINYVKYGDYAMAIGLFAMCQCNIIMARMED